MKIPSELICARIPAHIVPQWIEYCDKHKLSQSEAIRRAIAMFIYHDDSATNEELVIAATIEDTFLEHQSRRHGKHVRRRLRHDGVIFPYP